jgi:hypothetical protein
MPTLEPVITGIIALLGLLIGGGAGGFVVQYRRDKRIGRIDEVALLDEVRKVARDEVAYQREQMTREREDAARTLRRERLERERVELYVNILRDELRKAGIEVPDWPPALHVPRHVGDGE